MTERLVGQIVRKDVPEERVDWIGLGARAFANRAEIAAIWHDLQPVIDVAKLQLPKVFARGKALVHSLIPDFQTNPSNTEVAVFDIEWVQESLKKLGYFDGKIDGIFGPQTRAAVKKFQLDNPLLTPDEWPGPKTTAMIGAKLIEKGLWP